MINTIQKYCSMILKLTLVSAFLITAPMFSPNAAAAVKDRGYGKPGRGPNHYRLSGQCASLPIPSSAISKRADLKRIRPKKTPSTHAVGLVTFFDASAPDSAHSIGLEILGKTDTANSKIVRSLTYSGHFIMSQKNQFGDAEAALNPVLLPQVLAIRGRVQGAHTSDKLKPQFDIGPTLDLLHRDVLGVTTFAQIAERIHLEQGLLEHEITLSTQKSGFGMVARATLVTPTNKTAPVTAKLYTEISRTFGNNRFQGLIGAATSGKVSDWKNAVQVLTGLRFFI